MRVTYEIALPGVTRGTSLTHACTHAVVAQDQQGDWRVVALCPSPGDAEARVADWCRRHPAEPAQTAPTRVAVPLTEPQRQFLTEIGDRTIEVLGTSHLVPLVRRGLLDRRFIGQRWWRVRRTRDGRDAVEPPRQPVEK